MFLMVLKPTKAMVIQGLIPSLVMKILIFEQLNTLHIAFYTDLDPSSNGTVEFGTGYIDGFSKECSGRVDRCRGIRQPIC